MCTTPIQMTACQLTANEIFPLPVVKALLYPGAAVNGLVTNMTLPKWNDLLHMYNLTSVKNASAVVDLQRLEVCSSIPVKKIVLISKNHILMFNYFRRRFLLEVILLLLEP